LKRVWRKLIGHKGNAIHFCIFFISMVLVIWAIKMYQLTIIDNSYLVFACIVGGILFYFLLRLLPKSSYASIWVAFIRTSIGAGIFYFGVLFLNKTFREKETLDSEFLIIKKGHLAKGKGSCRQPYAIIDFYGFEKQLVFYCNFEEKIANATTIELRYSKGLFGFVVIESMVPKAD
jgi:hypothetical protein